MCAILAHKSWSGKMSRDYGIHLHPGHRAIPDTARNMKKVRFPGGRTAGTKAGKWSQNRKQLRMTYR